MSNYKYTEENGVSRFLPESDDLRRNSLRVKTTQNFDKKKLTVTKCGKEINVYDMIQESLPDTEIYTVMEKYNCTVDEAKERMKSNLKEIQGIFDMNVQFQDVLKTQIEVEEQFKLLPLEVREKFGNNLNRFLAEGKDWIDNEIKKTMPTEDLVIEKQTEIKGEENV